MWVLNITAIELFLVSKFWGKCRAQRSIWLLSGLRWNWKWECLSLPTLESFEHNSDQFIYDASFKGAIHLSAPLLVKSFIKEQNMYQKAWKNADDSCTHFQVAGRGDGFLKRKFKNISQFCTTEYMMDAFSIDLEHKFWYPREYGCISWSLSFEFISISDKQGSGSFHRFNSFVIRSFSPRFVEMSRMCLNRFSSRLYEIFTKNT